MDSAKARGWVNGFAVMETEAGSTATIATNDGLSAAVQAAIRVSLADASSDRPREAIAFLRHLADWLTADAHGTHGALADDLARDIASVYQEAT